MVLLALRLPDLKSCPPSSSHERLRPTLSKIKLVSSYPPIQVQSEDRNWILLLRRSGWSLVVKIHTEVAVTPNPWTLKRREGRGEWKTTLVFKGSQQARSKGRAKRWCTPLSPFDGFFMFNLWWHPAGHQDHSSSPHWHVCSWISSPTKAFFWRADRGA